MDVPEMFPTRSAPGPSGDPGSNYTDADRRWNPDSMPSYTVRTPKPTVSISTGSHGQHAPSERPDPPAADFVEVRFFARTATVDAAAEAIRGLAEDRVALKRPAHRDARSSVIVAGDGEWQPI